MMSAYGHCPTCSRMTTYVASKLLEKFEEIDSRGIEVWRNWMRMRRSRERSIAPISPFANRV